MSSKTQILSSISPEELQQLSYLSQNLESLLKSKGDQHDVLKLFEVKCDKDDFRQQVTITEQLYKMVTSLSVLQNESFKLLQEGDK